MYFFVVAHAFVVVHARVVMLQYYQPLVVNDVVYALVV